MLRCRHAFEEPQLLCRKRQPRLMHAQPGSIEYERFLRIEGEQRSLGGGKARRGKAAIADVFDVPIARIVSTVIFGSHHGVEQRTQGIAIHPQQHLRLGQPLGDIEMITVQGDTAIAISSAGKQGP